MAKNTLKVLDPLEEKVAYSCYQETYEFEIRMADQPCSSGCPNCAGTCKHGKGHAGQHSCTKGHKWSV